MKAHLLILCGLLALPVANAQGLSNADREALLARLAKIQEEANSRVDARFRTAIAAFRSAMGSEEQAMELYLKCVEKVDFEDQQKKTADFREWKRKESDRLSDPGLRRALRHQLRWLVLTLQAASENSDRAALASSAREIVNAIFDDAARMSDHHQLLRQPVTNSVFARAYEINSVKVERWPMSPAQIDQIYDQILMPPLRAAGEVATLRSAWQKRMEQEGAIREHWSQNNRGGGGGGERARIGMAADMRPPEYDKFIAEELPELVWAMETDLFRHGDQAAAAVRMLAHIEKNLTHRAATEWTNRLRELLAPAPAQGAAVP
jgi:hypothetical protein